MALTTPYSSRTMKVKHTRMISAIIGFVVTCACLFSAMAIVNPVYADDAKPITATKVTLPNYYSNGMVFQRKKPMVVQGKTTKYATLTITVKSGKASSSKTITAQSNGKFIVKLKPLSARLKPYSLTITSGNTIIKRINKVYVGDVFVTAGQSNMELSYNRYYGTASMSSGNRGGAFKEADLPDNISDEYVRFISTEHTGDEDKAESDLPLSSFNEHGWLAATDNDARNMSYIAQYFAQYLRKQSPKIPIGFIQSAWGGTALRRHMVGGDIYNTHIAPLKNLNIAGVLWYQGEDDTGNVSAALSYAADFTTLINQYRRIFNDDQLPFLYAQLARYDSEADTQSIRQAQLDTLHAVAETRNVAMTVSIDTDKGTSSVIHPLGKDILGYRMAQQWEAMIHDETVPSGPIPTRALPSKDSLAKVIVRFSKSTKKGLQAMKPIYTTKATATHTADATSQALQGFEAAGTDGIFHSAQAVINDDDTLTITSSGISKIMQVRYLWDSNPSETVLLYNNQKLPASPFTLSVEQPKRQ